MDCPSYTSESPECPPVTARHPQAGSSQRELASGLPLLTLPTFLSLWLGCEGRTEGFQNHPFSANQESGISSSDLVPSTQTTAAITHGKVKTSVREWPPSSCRQSRLLGYEKKSHPDKKKSRHFHVIRQKQNEINLFLVKKSRLIPCS